MATILGQWYARIKGGWKTVGVPGLAAFDGGEDFLTAVGPIGAIKLSAYLSCMRLIAETMGCLELKIKDKQNNIVKEHDLYGLMASPNAYQTGDQFISAVQGNAVMFGNGLGLINRFASNGQPYSIDFYSTDRWQINEDIDGRPTFNFDGEEIPRENVFHIPGFSINGYWGIPSLVYGADILRTSKSSNDAAQRTFASGLKVGGFFKIPPNQRWPEDDQYNRFQARMAEMSRPGAEGKWMPILPGWEPFPNTQFKIDPMTAELLMSRNFSVEEICRMLGVPPPLVGHSDKASSWASSLSSLNQFLVSYTLLPKVQRQENVMTKKLLSKRDQNRLKIEYDMDSLLRADITARWNMYKTARQINVMCPNDVLREECMPLRKDAGGESYTIEQTINQNAGSDVPANKEGITA